LHDGIAHADVQYVRDPLLLRDEPYRYSLMLTEQEAAFPELFRASVEVSLVAIGWWGAQLGCRVQCAVNCVHDEVPRALPRAFSCVRGGELGVHS
jgi:hypothetical protein